MTKAEKIQAYRDNIAQMMENAKERIAIDERKVERYEQRLALLDHPRFWSSRPTWLSMKTGCDIAEVYRLKQNFRKWKR